MGSAAFLVSLDFELYWGVRDKRRIEDYRDNLLGVRAAIPAMLALFKKYEVDSTWATVGFLLFDTKRELIAHLPERTPVYKHSRLSPYLSLDAIGRDEREDPFHFGLSLARQIVDAGAELSTHTFSHFYCLEDGPTLEDFRSDLRASRVAVNRIAPPPRTIVFPRNQYSPEHLNVCAEEGLIAFRGNPEGWFYEAAAGDEQGPLRRGARLLDTYLNLTGANACVPIRQQGLTNLPSSRFLRPYSRRLRTVEGWRMSRIRSAMTSAAREGKGFHLWWHPHNFGTNLGRNLENLEGLLAHYRVLRDRHGMQSLTMRAAAENLTQGGAR